MVTVTSLNAADYGLTSGSTNQTSNLQAAINAAQTQGLPLFIPKGTFLITTVNITSPVEIYSIPGTTQIQGYGQTPKFNIAPSVAGNRFGPVTIRDMYFEGAGQTLGGTNQGIIYASEIDNISIRNCYVGGSGFHGISLYDCAGRIESNKVVGNAEFGIFCNDSNDAVFIEQNYVTWSGNNGIYLSRSSNGSDQSVISDNQVGLTSANNGGTGPYGNAILVVNANYVKITNNMIFSSAFSAIRVNNCSNIEIIGNQCYGSNENAIYLEAPGSGATWYGMLVANNRVDTCGSGITAANSNFGAHFITITGNVITNCSNNTITYSGGSYSTWGRGIYSEADSLIANNQIDSTDEWGIFVQPSNNGTIGTQKVLGHVQNNMLKNCAGGICFYKDDTTYGRLFIGGNMIYNYTTTTKFAAIVPGGYNGADGSVNKIPGATDLGNATTSGFANVTLLLNYSFT